MRQRRGPRGHYEQACRDDLANQEKFETEVIQHYLPEPLGEAELDALIDDAMARTGAASIKDMGKVMKVVMPKLAGKNVDGRTVNDAVRRKLGG